MRPVGLYLLTGFLGSGKTTVLNSMLSHVAGKRVGVVLNDFGKIGVDSSLVPDADGILKTELKGGQIFCSCLSGSFVDAVLALVAHDPDIILVETSGLAKPGPMLEIISWILDKSSQRVSYQGMVCIIDAERFPILLKTVKAVEEQAVFSDMFIINKTDFVDNASLDETRQILGSIQPHARIIATSDGTVPSDLLELQADTRRLASMATNPYCGWGTDGRPKHCIITPAGPVTDQSMEALLTRIAHAFFRIKGTVRSTEGDLLFAGSVGPRIELRHMLGKKETSPTGLVCIHRATFNPKTLIEEAWGECCTVGMELEIV